MNLKIDKPNPSKPKRETLDKKNLKSVIEMDEETWEIEEYRELF